MVFRADKIDFIEDTAHMLLRILGEGNQRGEIDILTFSWWGARAKSGGGGVLCGIGVVFGTLTH